MKRVGICDYRIRFHIWYADCISTARLRKRKAGDFMRNTQGINDGMKWLRIKEHG